MKLQQSKISPHVIAAIGNITVLTFLPLFFYFVLLLVINDAGGPLNLILIPCTNFLAANLFTWILFLPLSKFLDRLFQKELGGDQPRAGSFLFSGIALCFFLVLVLIGFIYTASQVLGQQTLEPFMEGLFRFLLIGGVPFLSGGVTYWFLLQVSRKLVSVRESR